MNNLFTGKTFFFYREMQRVCDQQTPVYCINVYYKLVRVTNYSLVLFPFNSRLNRVFLVVNYNLFMLFCANPPIPHFTPCAPQIFAGAPIFMFVLFKSLHDLV